MRPRQRDLMSKKAHVAFWVVVPLSSIVVAGPQCHSRDGRRTLGLVTLSSAESPRHGWRSERHMMKFSCAWMRRAASKTIWQLHLKDESPAFEIWALLAGASTNEDTLV